MSELPSYRRFLKGFHPEAIPRLGSIAYNWASKLRIFQIQYELVTADVCGRWTSGKLLDVGTGPGRLLIELHRKAPGFDLVGIDIAPGMVAQARNNMELQGISEKVSIREGSADALPFEETSFDLVLSTGSFHHWKNEIGGLNECYRVLKPGGSALIYDLIADTPKSVLRQSRRDHGWFATQLFWLHGFEEPFHTEGAFRRIGEATEFNGASTRFVGLLCCLEMEKDGTS